MSKEKPELSVSLRTSELRSFSDDYFHVYAYLDRHKDSWRDHKYQDIVISCQAGSQDRDRSKEDPYYSYAWEVGMCTPSDSVKLRDMEFTIKGLRRIHKHLDKQAQTVASRPQNFGNFVRRVLLFVKPTEIISYIPSDSQATPRKIWHSNDMVDVEREVNRAIWKFHNSQKDAA